MVTTDQPPSVPFMALMFLRVICLHKFICPPFSLQRNHWPFTYLQWLLPLSNNQSLTASCFCNFSFFYFSQKKENVCTLAITSSQKLYHLNTFPCLLHFNSISYSHLIFLYTRMHHALWSFVCHNKFILKKVTYTLVLSVQISLFLIS